MISSPNLSAEQCWATPNRDFSFLRPDQALSPTRSLLVCSFLLVNTDTDDVIHQQPPSWDSLSSRLPKREKKRKCKPSSTLSPEQGLRGAGQRKVIVKWK
jgi:hypothetical protein